MKMCARWVRETLWPESPQIDYTIIARWWPWEYFCVSTIQISNNPEETRETMKRISEPPLTYVTRIYRCDKNGKGEGAHFYVKEYHDLAMARRGHKEVVELLAKGGLQLPYQNFQV